MKSLNPAENSVTAWQSELLCFPIEEGLAGRLAEITRESHGCEAFRCGFKTDGGLCHYTALVVATDANVRLALDPRFSQFGIATDGLLINWHETGQGVWPGKRAATEIGTTPEDLVVKAGVLDNSVAFYPNHLGWNLGECCIMNGRRFTLPHDPHLDQTADFLCLTNNGWSARRLPLRSEDKQDIADIKVGFSVPLLIKENQPQEIGDLLHLPRLAGDPRNGINFTPGGAKNPEEFFPIFRLGPMMLVDSAAYKRIFEMGSADAPIILKGQTKLTPEGLEVLRRNMSEEMSALIEFGLDGPQTTFTIRGPLPRQRIPAFVHGINEKGQFVSLAVDGRQNDRSVGLTFHELQKLAAEWGLVNAALGPAGNDTYFAMRTNGEFWYAGSPSGGKSRAVPGVMIVSPPPKPLASEARSSKRLR